MEEENQEYEELVDEAQDQFEQGEDLQDAQLAQYEATYPQEKKEQTIYNWFWRVVRLNNPFSLAKVGNLNNKEIGDYGISMRDAMNLAHLGQIFHHSKFGNYFATRSKITAASSMSKQGWFMDLSISQKKVRERARKPSSSGEQKWRIFNKRKTQQSQQNDE